jgi:hypothetical protein
MQMGDKHRVLGLDTRHSLPAQLAGLCPKYNHQYQGHNLYLSVKAHPQ